MTTATAVHVLSGVVRERARSEAREITAMLEFRDRELAAADAEPSVFKRVAERASIPAAIAEAMGLSEGQVAFRLSAGDTVRDQSPIVWEAFCEGRIDFGRVRDIAKTIGVLRRAESVHRLDRLVVAYAETHTAAELRDWLRRFVQRVEADLAIERAEAARADRHVSITHGDDSMAFLGAHLASHEAAAIAARLRKAARTDVDPDDTRTVAQREADLLVAWLLGSTAAKGAVDANIAVTVPADVLAGARPGFAESSDGRWGVPAQWIADVAASGSTFWHRIVTDEVGDDILSHEYLGRFAPDILNIALQFLHGTCQAPGCMVPAEHCDTDHRVQWPHGPTRADNLGPLCRRHHTLKGHGLLHWTVLPTGDDD